jgi:uncharacterized membrane protein
MDYKKIVRYLSWSRLKNNPAEFFLYVALLAGIGFIIVTPPFQGWDESEHFLRIYQISNLGLYPEAVDAPNASGKIQGSTKGYGGELPASLQEVSQDLRYNIRPDDRSYNYTVQSEAAREELDSDRTKDIRFDNTAIYSPVPYAAGAIGAALGRVFDQGPVVLLYLARLFHLAFWIGLLYAALKMIPVGKLAFLIIILSPVSVFIAATLSPDAVAVGLLGLILALILKIRAKNMKIDIKQGVLLGVLVSALLLVKNIYLPVLLLLLLIPKKLLAPKMRAALFMVPIVLFTVWNVSVMHMTSTIPNYFNTTEHVNSGDQLSFILHHPLAFLKLLAINTFGSASIALPSTYNGLIIDNTVPHWITVGWTGILVLALFAKEKTKDFLKGRSKSILIILSTVLVGIIVLTIVSLYIGWTPVASSIVYGVQGRYFIAASLLLIPIAYLSPIKVDPAKDVLKKVIYMALPLFLVVTIGVLAHRYIFGG